MTDERQALFELIEKRADADFVRELLVPLKGEEAHC
jgi:hypothetical protein